MVPVAYDSDDNTNPNFIVGGANTSGLVAAPLINLTSINVNAKPNANNWLATGYTPAFNMTPVFFKNYVTARKEYRSISTLASINDDGIYIWTGIDPLPINDTTKVRFDDYKVVLISSGTINMNATIFAPTDGVNPVSTAFIAPTINFSNNTTEVNGIFIADNINTGTTSNQGLKVVGNIIAQSSFTNGRQWTNDNVPSVFVVFNQQKYLDLLPYLSTVNYEWNQTQ